MSDEVFPEDSGLNSNLVPDWSDAAHFAQLSRPIDDEYVFYGMGATVDFGDLTFDINPGAFTTIASEGDTQDHTNDTPSEQSKTLNELRFVGQYDGKNGITLLPGVVNHVWMEIDLTDPDTIDVIVQDNDSDPGAPETPTMKYAVIDVPNGNYRLTNRGPRHEETVNFSARTPKVITHGIGEKYPSNIMLYDQNDINFEPSGIEPINEEQIEIETATDRPDCKVVVSK